METIDLRSEWKQLYSATRRPALIEVPTRKALTIDGEGAPAGEAFQQAIAALYGVAYTLKFTLKRAAVADFPVMPLEALWDNPDADGGPVPAWRWRALIAVPDLVTSSLVRSAAAAAAERRASPAIAQLRLRSVREGLCAQVLHVGAYAAEPPTIERLLRFIAEQGYVPAGRQHEIYLSDPGRTAPDRLRTLIRYPVKRAPRTAAARK